MNMSVRKKLVVIDGKSVFYRGYYAMSNLRTADGTPTGGIYGFCVMALEIIKSLKPDYVCVAWDKPKTNIQKRLEIYPEYKSGRKPAPDDFYVQIPILHEVLKAFNWPLYEVDGYEADDIMATFSKKAGAAGIDTVLISGDKDMYQMISDHTKVLSFKKNTPLKDLVPLTVDDFEKEYKIKINQFVDYKSIVGDSSDNIPGAAGLGPVATVELLNAYETLDEIYENLALIKTKYRKSLEANKELVFKSRKLVSLMLDAPVKLDLKQMDIHKLDVNKLAAILKKLEFRSLLRNLPEGMQATNLGNVAPADTLHSLKTPKVVSINTKKGLISIKLDGDVVLHTRCKGKHGKNPTVILLSDENTCYAIDFSKIKLPISQFPILNAVIGHDLKASFKVLLELGLDMPRVSHDTLIGAFIINSLRRDLTLNEMSSTDLGYETELDNLDDDELLLKAGEVVAVIRALSVMQGEKMSEVTSLIKLAEVVDWPVIPVLASMERTGMKLNTEFFNELSEDFSDRISDVEQTIYGYANKEFNIASPAQLSEVLFVDLGLPDKDVKKGKSGNYSTASGILENLRTLHPIIKSIEEFREYSKLKNTYIDPLPKMVDENDRVHSTLNLTVAQTGRLSSVDPNLQNIPVRTEVGREIRKGFIAEKGNVLISADYSQFELRIAAAMSGDELMIESFNQDRDIHVETAALIQGVDPSEVTKEMRYAAKAVNFGILYGQGVHGLSNGTGISYSDAKEFIEKYFSVRPKLKEMIELFRNQAKNRGYVETIMGRRRPTPDAQSSNYMVREAAYRAAINMPIQGGAADLTKMAMSKLEEKFIELRVKNKKLIKPESRSLGIRKDYFWPQQIMQVHDSIVVECPEKEADKIAKIMKDVMENIYPKLGVKLKVDVNIGNNWSEI
jgi:DNA polymerase I